MTTAAAPQGDVSPPAASPLETVTRIASQVARVHADAVDRESRFPVEAIDALKRARMLGLLVPASLGGPEAGLDLVAAMCEALAQHCASTAMVFAMHHIQ